MELKNINPYLISKDYEQIMKKANHSASTANPYVNSGTYQALLDYERLRSPRLSEQMELLKDALFNALGSLIQSKSLSPNNRAKLYKLKGEVLHIYTVEELNELVREAAKASKALKY